LIQSDGQSPADRDDLIDLHLEAATYNLEIETLSGSGTFNLAADFTEAAPPFEPVPVEARPWDLTSADFNGDGVPDLATANPFNNNVSVLLGRGDGTFSSPTKYATGLGAWEIIAADFNGDGRLDLATANSFGVTVSVLLSRGDGTFSPPVQSF